MAQTPPESAFGAIATALLMQHHSEQQQLLLRAALLDGQAALDAWEAWRSSPTIYTLDASSGWLLPLLYCNLVAQGITGPEIDHYACVYRLNWHKNHMLFHRAIEALSPLSRSSVLVVWLKGGALEARSIPKWVQDQ